MVCQLKSKNEYRKYLRRSDLKSPKDHETWAQEAIDRLNLVQILESHEKDDESSIVKTNLSNENLNDNLPILVSVFNPGEHEFPTSLDSPVSLQ